MGIMSIGKLVFGLPKLLFKYWYVVGFIIILLPSIVTSINAGIEGEDWAQPLKDAGRYIASQDIIIYDFVETLKYDPVENGSLSDKVDYYFLFWANILWKISMVAWIMFFTFMITFRFTRWILGDKSADLRAFLVTIVIMSLAQILVAGVPFKGVKSLIDFIIYEVIL